MDRPGGRRGRPPHPDILTPAEWHVLEQLRDGLTNAEIAVRLGISPDGVKYHVSNMLAKLDLADRHALAKWKPPRGGIRGRVSLKGALLSFGGLCGAAAAGVAIIIGVGALGSSSSRPDSALPDIHSTLDITSFQLTEKLTYDAHVPLPNGGGTIPLPPGGTHDTSTVYFRSPDQLRQEQTDTTVDGETGQRETEPSVSLSKGSDDWQWTPGSTDVEQSTNAPFESDELAYLYPKKGASLRALVARRALGASVHMAGEGTVAGRSAYIIEIDPRPCATTAADLNGRRLIWLDKETLFPLKSEQSSAADGRLTVSTEVTSIRYNQPLADSLFELPAAATVHPETCFVPSSTPGGTAGTAGTAAQCAAIRAQEYASAQATAAACPSATEPPATPTTAASGLSGIHATLKVTSYELTQTTYMASQNMSVNSQPETTGPLESTRHIWFEAGKLREETRAGGASANVVATSSAPLIRLWPWPPPPFNVALGINNLSGLVDAMGGHPAAWPVAPKDMASVVTDVAPNGHGVIKGQDIVAGRPVYVVDVFANCTDSMPPSTETLWIDKQTLFVLREEKRSPSTSQVISSWEVTSVSYNTTIRGDTFDVPINAASYSPNSDGGGTIDGTVVQQIQSSDTGCAVTTPGVPVTQPTLPVVQPTPPYNPASGTGPPDTSSNVGRIAIITQGTPTP